MKESFFFDFETTGLPVFKEPSGGDNQPHIVQVAAVLCDAETRKVKQTIDVIIKPDGFDIPQEVTDIHGITNEYAHDVGVPEKLAFEMFFAMWNGNLRVAHNTTFDNRIARIGTKRFFSEDLQVAWKEGEYQCTGLLSKPIMQMLPKGRYGYKMPKLSEAYEHFTGKPLKDAHTAISDVNACMEVYWAIQDRAEAAA